LFARYAAIVKNLRGVVLVNLDKEDSWNKVRWLIRRFRYRDLGLPPYIVDRYRAKLSSYLNGNPFRELVYPIPELIDIVKFYEERGFPRDLAEALVLSSTYISPLLVIGSDYLRLIESISIGNVKVCKDLSDNDWKLHLRIADYTILDMYEKSIQESIEAIRLLSSINNIERINEILKERTSRVEKDRKRYWRIICKEDGKVFIYYIDPLKFLVETLEKGVEFTLKEDYAAALAIIPVVNLSL